MDTCSDSNAVRSIQQIGDDLFRNGLFEDAIAAYSVCILPFNLQSAKAAPFLVLIGTIINSRAQCYIDLGDFDQALRDLNWIIHTFISEPMIPERPRPRFTHDFKAIRKE